MHIQSFHKALGPSVQLIEVAISNLTPSYPLAHILQEDFAGSLLTAKTADKQRLVHAEIFLQRTGKELYIEIAAGGTLLQWLSAHKCSFQYMLFITDFCCMLCYTCDSRQKL